MKETLVKEKNGSVAYELNADTVCTPVYISEGNKNYTLFVRTTPLDYFLAKRLMSSIQVTRAQKAQQNYTEQEVSESAPVRDIVSDVFQELKGMVQPSGEPYPIDIQKKFLERRPSVTELIGISLVSGIAAPEYSSSNGHEGLVFDINEDDTQEVESEVTIGDYDSKEEVAIPVKHIMSGESEGNRIAYRKIRKTRIQQEGKTSYSWNNVNYEGINKLYDSMIVNLEGVLFDGEPLNPVDKPTWVQKIPLRWKVFALDAFFNRVGSKKN